MIKIIIDKKEHRLDKKRARIETIFKKLHLNPETTLALRGGEIITEDEDLFDDDTCVIMRTVAKR